MLYHWCISYYIIQIAWITFFFIVTNDGKCWTANLFDKHLLKLADSMQCVFRKSIKISLVSKCFISSVILVADRLLCIFLQQPPTLKYIILGTFWFETKSPLFFQSCHNACILLNNLIISITNRLIKLVDSKTHNISKCNFSSS